ncbi:MAG: nitrous oxide-stimulated promoter family protein [Thermoanaerobaculales bacterium]|nr:nitrous oxide-stimulated promoter family protein [Thermoanaerobaculales bacterium]
MIRLYCGAHHDPTKEGLCRECLDLVHYTRRRLERCPFGEEKPVCDRCPLHCYQEDIRSQIRKVMRYSGPRMMLRHPILATRHFIDAHRPLPGRKGASL